MVVVVVILTSCPSMVVETVAVFVLFLPDSSSDVRELVEVVFENSLSRSSSHLSLCPPIPRPPPLSPPLLPLPSLLTMLLSLLVSLGLPLEEKMMMWLLLFSFKQELIEGLLLQKLPKLPPLPTFSLTLQRLP